MFAEHFGTLTFPHATRSVFLRVLEVVLSARRSHQIVLGVVVLS